MSLEKQFHAQGFPNGYELVDGVAMHEENGDRFQIPPDVLKKYVAAGHFVEIRMDSPRFSVHPDAPEKCMCESCQEEASKPVLTHEQPNSIHSVPLQNLPSRGWGEDFWVQIIERDGDIFRAKVDNNLVEHRLHEVQIADKIFFHSNHILAVHPSHRQDMVLSMNETDLKTLVEWLGTQ